MVSGASGKVSIIPLTRVQVNCAARIVTEIVQVAFAPDSGLLYTLNGNGTIYAIELK